MRFARQLGLGYLQFSVMEERKLVETHAQALGLTVSTVWQPLGTPTAINDALLTGSADVIGVGLPGFLTLWDRTRGNLNVSAIVSLNRSQNGRPRPRASS